MQALLNTLCCKPVLGLRVLNQLGNVQPQLVLFPFGSSSTTAVKTHSCDNVHTHRLYRVEQKVRRGRAGSRAGKDAPPNYFRQAHIETQPWENESAGLC